MKPKSPKRIEYSIGFILMSVYVFTSYVAVDVTISSSINTLALYAFLAWGMLTTMLYGVREGVPIYTVWYVVFMVVSFLAMTYGPEFHLLSGQFYLMIVSFFITYFIQMFVTDSKDFTRLCWMYAISSVALVLMLQFTGNLAGTADERLGQELMGNANIFAIVIMIATMLELWLFVYDAKSFPAKSLLIVMVLYNMYGLALSAGRKYVVIPFVFLYLLLFFKTNKRGKRNVILYTVIVAMLVIGAYNLMMTNKVLYESIGVRMEQLIEGQEDARKFDGSAKKREIMRNDAFEEWQKKPIFGYGFDSYKYRAQRVVKRFYYSHCNYVEMLYNGGLVMFLVYYWIYYKIVLDFLKKKNAQPKYRAFAIAMAISIFVLDYGAITYSASVIHILFALSLKSLDFKERNIENSKETEE